MRRAFIMLLLLITPNAWATPTTGSTVLVLNTKPPTKQKLRKPRSKRSYKSLDLRPTRFVAQAPKPSNRPAPSSTNQKEKLTGIQVTPLPPSKDLNLPMRTLSKVYQMAKKRNVSLRVLKQQLVLAEIARAQAWVPIKPTLSAMGSYTRNQFETALGDRVIIPQDQLSLSIQMQWQFLDFKNISKIQIAYLSRKQTGRTVAQVRRDLYFSVAQTYYSLLLAQGTLQISRDSWSNAQKHLKIADNRLQAGMSTRLAKMQAQLDVAKARQTWFKARNQLRNSKLTLALLLGQKRFPYLANKPAALQRPTGKLRDWTQRASARRHELKAMRLAMVIAAKQRQQAWLAFLPTASVSGGVNISNAGGFNGQNTNWNFGVNVNWALYSGGSRALAVRQAHAQLKKASLDFQKAKQDIDNEVRKAYLDLQNADVAVKISRRSAELARSTYQLRQQQYQVGMGTPISVSDANTQLLSAEVSFLSEALSRELAILRLRRAVGDFRP